MSSSSTLSSSPTHAFTFAEPPPTVTAHGSNEGSDNSGGSQRGASYFFGFLISFVVLLLVFAACGLGSRRRLVARREAEFLDTLEPWRSYGVDGELNRPAIYEQSFAPPVGPEWTYLRPLSVTLLRKTKQEVNPTTYELPHPDAEAARTPSHEISPYPSISLPSWITGKRKKPSTIIEPEPPEAIQVTVMIAMPSAPEDHPPAYDRPDVAHLPEYQIATTTLPWYSEMKSSSSSS